MARLALLDSTKTGGPARELEGKLRQLVVEQDEAIREIVEACDSTIAGIENGFNELGSFTWCPWTTEVLAELPPPAVNYLLPAGLPPGAVTASIVTGERRRFVDPPLYFHAYAPSLFSVTHDSLAAAGWPG
jgi:hypothetical protein